MPTMDVIDFKIYGDDMQFVEVELDPMEAAIAEPGGMMYMEDGIEMETIFGDGSQQQGGGFLNSLMGFESPQVSLVERINDKPAGLFKGATGLA